VNAAGPGGAILPVEYRRIAFDRAASTNDEARRLAEAGASERLAVTADVQTAGRGRQGRAWVSPHGNLHVSFVLRPSVKPAEAGAFGFGVAVAVAETIERLAHGVDAKCKWPNDVLVGGKKVAGILLESRGTPETLDWLICGIGLNVAEAPEKTAWPATSLTSLGANVPVERALETMTARFDHWYRHWLIEGFAPLRQAWLARAHALGKMLKVGRNGDEREGKFVGLDPSGALVLEHAGGRRETISYGEVLS
jgi:BirA family biotin operon repressor/biotin-[acetyl-CoA-carboxylase] ligase